MNILSYAALRNLGNMLDFISSIYFIITLISLICIIVIAVNITKIKNVQCKPFQNKKPDYPDKVIELMQSIVSMQQHQMQEIEKLRKEIEVKNNDGVKPGMKTPTTIHNEEMIKLQKEQNDLLQKILEVSNGEEKKKMMEKWKQATELINSGYKE